MLPGDAIAHVHVSWLSPVKIRSVVFGGSRRHLVWDETNPAQRISLYERDVDIEQLASPDAQRDKMIQYRGDMHAPALDEHEGLQGVVREFSRSIRGRGTPMTEGRAGRHGLSRGDDELARRVRLLGNLGSGERYVHETMGMNPLLAALQSA